MPANTTVMMDDTEFSVSSDLLIHRSMLTELINETAKLKGSSVTRDLPTEKLNKLVHTLHWNVKDGARLLPMLDRVCIYY